jgi:hypothetical protein
VDAAGRGEARRGGLVHSRFSARSRARRACAALVIAKSCAKRARPRTSVRFLSDDTSVLAQAATGEGTAGGNDRRGRVLAPFGASATVHSTVRMGLLIDHVGTWAAAVEMESNEALRHTDHFKTDLGLLKLHGFLLALSLRNLIRAVEWAKRDASAAKDGARESALHKVLDAFNERVPNVKKFRDVVEYLDNSVGQWGDREHKDVRQVTAYLERTSRGVVRLYVAPDLFLDVREAADAAQKLAERATEIIRR